MRSCSYDYVHVHVLVYVDGPPPYFARATSGSCAVTCHSAETPEVAIARSGDVPPSQSLLARALVTRLALRGSPTLRAKFDEGTDSVGLLAAVEAERGEERAMGTLRSASSPGAFVWAPRRPRCGRSTSGAACRGLSRCSTAPFWCACFAMQFARVVGSVGRKSDVFWAASLPGATASGTTWSARWSGMSATRFYGRDDVWPANASLRQAFVVDAERLDDRTVVLRALWHGASVWPKTPPARRAEPGDVLSTRSGC